MANIVQSTYGSVQPRGFAGQRATTVGWDGITKINTDDVVIPFGRACSREGDRGCELGGTDFIGVAQADQAKDGVAPPAGSADSYAIGDNVSLQSEGDIFVVPGANVDPTKVVAYAPATGIFGPHDGTYSVVVEGAKYIDTVTAGSGAVVIVRLSQKQGNNVAST